ncbi:MAG: metallopeptidase TldD-related protein [Pseudonocardia sp.]
MRATELVERALAVPGDPAGVGRVVLVSEDSEASLRWANNTMTTNGHATSVSWTVISMVRLPGGGRTGGGSGGGGRTGGGSGGGGVGAGVVTSSALVTDPTRIAEAVAASEAAARQAGPARDAIELPEPAEVAGATGRAWDDPAEQTSVGVFGALVDGLADAFARAGSAQRVLYGFAHHQVNTTWLGTSTGVRLAATLPTGSVELNAKTVDLARSAWTGRPTPTPGDLAALDVVALDGELAGRLAWGRRRIELRAGRYPTILPPSCVADLMTRLVWQMTGRSAREGRSAFSAPPGATGPTRVGERLSTLPLTLYTDPAAADGLAGAPYLATAHSDDDVSVFDNGAPVRRVDWVANGTIGALTYPRAAARQFGDGPDSDAGSDARFTPPAGNLILTADSATPLDELVAGTERGLLLTCLWYIRMVDPASLLLTGLTRDGVYLVDGGEVVGEVNNFRFNESPLDLLRRVSAAGVTERTLPRELKDWFTRAVMPPLVVPDFHMSSVSRAS